MSGSDTSHFWVEAMLHPFAEVPIKAQIRHAVLAVSQNIRTPEDL